VQGVRPSGDSKGREGLNLPALDEEVLVYSMGCSHDERVQVNVQGSDELSRIQVLVHHL
jgi:hypothetical protein